MLAARWQYLETAEALLRLYSGSVEALLRFF
jgi:hypothetical protein